MREELSTLQLSDIVLFLKSKMGKLTIHTTNNVYMLHIAHQNITAVTSNGASIVDTAAVTELVKQLLVLKQGSFEFTTVRPAFFTLEGMLSEIAIPLDMFATVQTDAALPQEATDYKALSGIEFWLEQELDDFWYSAKHLLNAGSNAKVIAQQLGLSVGRVRFKMHRLRELGAIKIVA